MRMAEGMDEDEDVELALVTEVGGGVGRSGRHTSCSSTWEYKISFFSRSYDIFRSNLISPKNIFNILKKKTKTWPESFGYLVLLPTTDWRGRLGDVILGVEK